MSSFGNCDLVSSSCETSTTFILSDCALLYHTKLADLAIDIDAFTKQFFNIDKFLGGADTTTKCFETTWIKDLFEQFSSSNSNVWTNLDNERFLRIQYLPIISLWVSHDMYFKSIKLIYDYATWIQPDYKKVIKELYDRCHMFPQDPIVMEAELAHLRNENYQLSCKLDTMQSELSTSEFQNYLLEMQLSDVDKKVDEEPIKKEPPATEVEMKPPSKRDVVSHILLKKKCGNHDKYPYMTLSGKPRPALKRKYPQYEVLARVDVPKGSSPCKLLTKHIGGNDLITTCRKKYCVTKM